MSGSNVAPSDARKFINRPELDPKFSKGARELSGWKSIALGIGVLGFSAFLMWFGGKGTDWRAAPITFLLIAGLQNHLLILLHEGAHGLVHPKRRWNDFWTDLLCGVPMLTPLKNYRWFHLKHHQHSGEPGDDPEHQLYEFQDYNYERRSAPRALFMLFLDICGVNAVRFLISFNRPLLEMQKKGEFRLTDGRDMFMNLLFWGPVAAAATYFGFWTEILVFWLLPYFTLTILLLKLHGYGEHTGLEGPTEFERTWVHDFNPVTNFFVYPIKSGYHLEHHIFPQVPWYNMESFRRKLLEIPYYRKLADKVTVDGYFFGRRTIWRAMILGRGFYVKDPEFAAHLAERKEELRSLGYKET